MADSGPAAAVTILDGGIDLRTDGVALDADTVLDLVLDGRRVWSFRASLSGEARAVAEGERGAEPARWWVAWPDPFLDHLDGTAHVAIRRSGGQDDEVLAEREVAFTTSPARASLTRADGRPMTLDSKGRLTTTFEGDTVGRSALIAAAQDVLAVMRDVGLDGFLAYGTLLGAVREGSFIGHDDDVDLGYVSDHADPVHVVRESFRLERTLIRGGMAVERYSGAGIKVSVTDAQGAVRGLDIFGGFWDGDRIAFLGEIHAPFAREWITPLSSASLDGVEFPVPAAPERLLELMYGPGWRTPDPTFVFDPDAEGRVALGRWFRGIRERRNAWDRWNSAAATRQPFLKPHHVARLLHRAEPEHCTVIDVGCGRGQDAAFLASKGHRSIGLDYSLRATGHHLERAREHGWPFEAHTFNLLDLRQVLSRGARYAREIEGPRAVLARHVVNATSLRAWDGLFRFSSMVLRGGGALYLEFFTEPDPPPEVPDDDLVWTVATHDVAAAATAAGGEVVSIEQFEPNWFELPWTSGSWDPKPTGCRMVVRWP